MSQYILCKGIKPLKKMEEVVIYCYPFDDFYNQVCEYFWDGQEKDDIWTIEVSENIAIDDYFTEAQEQIYDGIEFEKTKIYYVLNQLLQYNLEIVMWYSDYYNDIPTVCTKQELFKAVFDGITNISGMCEVYVRFKNSSLMP